MNLKKGGEFMNLGDKLLKLRKDNKMSQEEFAEALDVQDRQYLIGKITKVIQI